mmetsp:Transcript_27589/g.55214  ORF Transcript_27589/g.55214 Transcript_27589/m.55214 type:complete len:83 (+) Transcript_27589:20-268(+)
MIGRYNLVLHKVLLVDPSQQRGGERVAAPVVAVVVVCVLRAAVAEGVTRRRRIWAGYCAAGAGGRCAGGDTAGSSNYRPDCG